MDSILGREGGFDNVVSECFSRLLRQGKWGHAWQIYDYMGSRVEGTFDHMSDTERKGLAIEVFKRESDVMEFFESRYRRTLMLGLLKGKISSSRDEYERKIEWAQDVGRQERKKCQGQGHGSN